MKIKIKNEKTYKRWRRHKHVRNNVKGTPERPRICVYRSNQHIYAQVIDDSAGRTLVSGSSLKIDPAQFAKPDEKKSDAGENAAKAKDTKGQKKGGKGKKDKKKEKAESRQLVIARAVGRNLAEAAKEKGVTKVAFDRGGYLYHGRVAALADGLREGGLDF